MREIKFRGKRADNGEWIYGDLSSDGLGNYWIIGPVVEADEEYIAHEYWWNVNPKTVGQLIGLKDKNGQEIYEGDILEYRDYMWNYDHNQVHLGVVVWRDNTAGFICERRVIDGEVVEPNYGLCTLAYNKKAKVIGNIYENSNLLEARNA